MEYFEKFYQCDCGSEGIMMSYEREKEGVPFVDLAYFREGFDGRKLSFFQKVRWCYHILKIGQPWHDMVMLNQITAKRLGLDLIKFSEKKYNGRQLNV